MDSQDIVIGYNTINGRRIANSAKKNMQSQKREEKTRAKGNVDVYYGDVYIREVPLSLLVRFSTTAQNAFPKPKKAEAGGEDGQVVDWAEDGGYKIDVAELSTGFNKLNVAEEAGEQAAAVNSGEQVEVDGKMPNKKLDLAMSELWVGPSVDALKFAFKWMFEARRTAAGAEVLTYGVPHPETISLEQLVDYYAASLCLGLRPAPHKLRGDIFNRVTNKSMSVFEIKYMHEHLPIDNPVITRMITAFVQTRGKNYGWYSKAQRDDIEDYFHNVDDALYYRYEGIVKHREQQRMGYQRDLGANRLQKMAEGFEDEEEGNVGTYGEGPQARGGYAGNGGRGRNGGNQGGKRERRLQR